MNSSLSPSRLTDASNRHAKILIVDDLPENLHAMQVTLTPLEVEMHTASSGNQALAKMLTHDFAVVLLDVQMPHMDGFEAAALMQNNQATRGVPIIFVTALSKENEHVFKGYETGAVDYLFKPVNPDILLSKVAVFINLYNSKVECEIMHKELERSRNLESIGFLAGGIAHDFNNILFPIMGHTEMLLEDIPEGSPFRDSLNKIYSGSLRARDLVNQILTFSRLEDSELIALKIQSIIKEALKLIRSTIPASIDIIQDIQTNCSAIKANPTQIHQIIMNLTTNASHAMSDTGGELKVTLKEIELDKTNFVNPDMKSGLYALLIVSDQGMGMDLDLTKKIFDPFFTTKEKGKGTGMGLSVVHGIVKSMDGAIEVYSNPGTGTEFKLYFPTQKSSFKKPVARTKFAIPGGNEKIMLVDDEDDILKMEKRLLERLGYQVTVYRKSIEALEAFCSNPTKFDLVISDMAMPGLSGDQLAEKLIKLNPGIPILLCTGFSEGLSEEKMSSMGVKGLLMKPIVTKELAKMIRHVLDGDKNSSI